MSRWIWHHSVSDVDYTGWAPGFPSNQDSGDDCAVLSPYEGYEWTDVSCDQTFGSPVCMRDLEDDNTTATSGWPTTTTTSSWPTSSYPCKYKL